MSQRRLDDQGDWQGDWQAVCRLAALGVGIGATALVHGQAVAIFKMSDDVVHALGNHDPFAKVSVIAKGIAKGIVGVRDGVPFVVSPTHRHGFDLRTGQCLDDPHVAIPVYQVRVVDGIVQVGHRKDV